MSWIAIEDALAAIEWALASETLRGPVNAVAPGVVRNREFARTLGRVLGRPALIPAPAFALRAMLGPMADEMLLASQRAVPRRLSESGFRFRTPELEGTLRRLLGRELLSA
jgi:NAD dependent epimerase/dehydratase family enzyme